MKKFVIAIVAATTALSGVMASSVAVAQPGHYDRGHDRYDRDRDRGHDRYDRRDRHDRHDRYDRGDRRGRANWDRWYRHDRWAHGHRYYGGKHGYNGYRGHWRAGQRYPYWRDNAYVISDYRAYRLPPPRAGYRYYRDDNGDIVMAAIASGVIGLIIGSQLN